MSVIDEAYILHNGKLLPKIGLGTYKLTDGEESYRVVLRALEEGVRHIDSAIIYRNEESVGKAIKDSNIPREEIFITSKLPPHIKKEKSARRMFEKTLKNLGLDYLDAYIINAPGPFHDLDGDYDEGNVEVYRFLESLYKEKLVGAIGVSQFGIKDLKNIIMHCEIMPHINQISFFVGHTQDYLVNYCKDHRIQIQGFSPLGKGYILQNPVIIELAKKYEVKPAQIALRYTIQKGVAPIPKSTIKQHLIENISLDFELSEEDMTRLDSIEDDPRQYDDDVFPSKAIDLNQT